MKNFLTLVGIIVVGAFLVFVYDCIVGLSEFAGRLSPGLVPWVFWGVLLPTAGSLGWWVAVALMRPKPIMVHADPTEEEMAGFRRQLIKRLGRNRILRDAGITVTDETGLEIGLNVLHDRADEEIRSTAKRVFIGTAVSQNGRLDALVVLFLISRLVWRISKLYDQRPHHRELMNLYANIAATAFLAGTLDEFGIEDTVHELVGPLMAGSALGAVPGAEAVAGTITASIMSGSTNCLLAMRCGIVARNYMSLDLDTKGQMRRNATLEAVKMFMTISAETVTQVTRLLVKSSSKAVKKNATKAAKSMGGAVAGAAGSVGNGAKSVGKGVRNSAQKVGQGAKNSARKIGDGARESARKVGEGAKESARKLGQGAKDSTKSVVDGVDRTVDKVAARLKDSARKVEEAAKGAAQKIEPTFDKAEARVEEAADKAKSFIRSATGRVEKTISKAREKVVRKQDKKSGD